MLNENSLDCQAISSRLYKLRSGKEKEFIEDTEGKKKFKRSRKGKPKYSLEEIEQKTGINRASLAQMEESFSPDKITLSDLYALAKCYECDVGFLLGEYECRTKDLQGIRDYTGLAESAVERLSDLKYMERKFLDNLLAVNDGGYLRQLSDTYRQYENFHEQVSLYGLDYAAISDRDMLDLISKEDKESFMRFKLYDVFLRFADDSIIKKNRNYIIARTPIEETESQNTK